MQRIRTSLPYFSSYNWSAEIVVVDIQYTDMPQDELLLQSIPASIKIHKVKALNKRLTSKIGLGSIALRSLMFYKYRVNQLLKVEKYDLIYFSTTQFPLCVLGAYWKKRFNVPYVIDFQDPWHSEYYRDKPKEQQPSKHWFSYRLNKYLEPVAIKNVDGLISVSDDYINDLKNRYPSIKNIPAATITFGTFDPDMIIAQNNKEFFKNILNSQFINLVYVGRGGADMYKAVTPLFVALKTCLDQDASMFSKIRLYFIGTSYAPMGHGKTTIMPLAKQFGVDKCIIEVTNRIKYYHTLTTLQQADALFIPGSDDPKYTPSKIFPYLLSGKQIVAIFNPASSALTIMKHYGVKHIYNYDDVKQAEIISFFKQLVNDELKLPDYNADAMKMHSAKEMTRQQCLIFNKAVNA